MHADEFRPVTAPVLAQLGPGHCPIRLALDVHGQIGRARLVAVHHVLQVPVRRATANREALASRIVRETFYEGL